MILLNRAVIALLIVTTVSACADLKKPEPAITGASSHLSPRERVEVFEDVWGTINDQYYDPSFHGTDWRAVHDRYRPRAERAATDLELYRTFEEMLAELRDAHTIFEHPRANGGDNVNPPGSVGFSIGDVEGKTIVTAVESGSVAAESNVRPGMVLRTVNGRSVEDLYSEIRRNVAGSSTEQSMHDVMLGALLYGGFLGPSRTFGIEDFSGKVREIAITRFGAPASHIPTLYAQRLSSGFGYIKFDGWYAPADARFKAELANLSDTPGLIIDLRGNGGGQSEVQLDIASLFFSSPTSFGDFRARTGQPERMITHESDLVYKSPVIILVDESSASASEVFAAAMQENGRAKIVGRRSCGCVLNRWNKKMKGGGNLGWSARVYASPRNRILEGVGVTPDITVPLTIADLRAGRDAPMEAAERLLKSNQADGGAITPI